MGVSCKSTPEGESARLSEGRSHICYWVEEGAAFNSEGVGVFHRVRRMTTTK